MQRRTKYENLLVTAMKMFKELEGSESFGPVRTTLYGDPVHATTLFRMYVNGFITKPVEHFDPEEGIFIHNVGLLSPKLRLGQYLELKKKKKDLLLSEVPIINIKTGFQSFMVKSQMPLLLVTFAVYKGAVPSSYQTALIGSYPAITAFNDYSEIEYQEQEAPKPGIYKAHVNNDFVIYSKVKKLSKRKVFHPETERVNNHILSFFANTEDLLKNESPGRKAIMLYGPQGTGKTSIITNIISSFSKTHSIVFSTEFNIITRHADLCAKHEVPCIIVAEDFMDNLNDQKVLSNIKNFLSGIDTSRNPKGCYFIITSNNPDRIDPSILFRKGRIDRLIPIGKLNVSSKELADCFRHYLSFYLDAERVNGIMHSLGNMMHDFSSLSGSEIEVIVQEARLLASIEGTPLSSHHIQTVIAEMLDETKKVIEFQKTSKAEMGSDPSGSLGFKQT